MFDNFEDFNLLDIIDGQEDNNPETINYQDDKSSDNSEDKDKSNEDNESQSVATKDVKRLYIKKENTNTDFTKEELQKLETNELKDAYSQLFDEKGNIKDRKDISNGEIDNFREESVYNEALIYGINSGLFYRMQQLKDFFNNEEIQSQLDQQFIFQNLMIGENRVQPPIVLKTEDIYITETDTKTREIKSSYTIKEQAKFVQSPKNWRQYIMPVLSAQKPEVPNVVMLPKPETNEINEWQQGIDDGWEEGIKMANESVKEQITKLRNDFLGMVRYHIMRQKNMISNPIIYNTPIGISRNNEGDAMNIGESIIEIQEVSIFNARGDEWKSLPEIDNLITGDEF